MTDLIIIILLIFCIMLIEILHFKERKDLYSRINTSQPIEKNKNHKAKAINPVKKSYDKEMKKLYKWGGDN